MTGRIQREGAETIVRRHVLRLLQEDIGLGELVQGVFDGEPPRATAPFVALAESEGREWGTKDREGRDVQVSVLLIGAGDSLEKGAAAAHIEAALCSLHGPVDGWTIVGARIIRTGFAHGKNGGWRQRWVMRCRCLAAA